MQRNELTRRRLRRRGGPGLIARWERNCKAPYEETLLTSLWASLQKTKNDTNRQGRSTALSISRIH